MTERPYTYIQVYGDTPTGEWRIVRIGKNGLFTPDSAVVWRMPVDPDWESIDGNPPAEVMAKYEELLAASGFVRHLEDAAPNLVEMVTLNDDDNAWDQPCAHGHRIGHHAVYCHNEGWLYSPRKCRRESWEGSDWPHEKCAGFLANPLYEKAAK